MLLRHSAQFVVPTGHHGVAQPSRAKKTTMSENLKEGARQVGKTVLRTINGAASGVSENNGLGWMDAETEHGESGYWPRFDRGTS